MYGTIENRFPTRANDEDEVKKVDEEDPRERKERNKLSGKPNFLTRPPKGGSAYGYANVTIGKQYEYISSPYDAVKKKEKSEREVAKAKRISENTFLSTAKPAEYFDAKIFRAPEGSKQGAPEREGTKKDQNKDNKRPPFRPSHPPRSGINATINKYPASSLPPMKSYEKATGEKSRPSSLPHFRTKGYRSAKSYPTPSIVERSATSRPSAWVQKQYEAAFRPREKVEVRSRWHMPMKVTTTYTTTTQAMYHVIEARHAQRRPNTSHAAVMRTTTAATPPTTDRHAVQPHAMTRVRPFQTPEPPAAMLS